VLHGVCRLILKSNEATTGRTPFTISISENQFHSVRPCRHMQLPASLTVGNWVVFPMVCCCVCELRESLGYGMRHIVGRLRFRVCLRPCNMDHSVQRTHSCNVLKKYSRQE
jgi:hypothetical protein